MEFCWIILSFLLFHGMHQHFVFALKTQNYTDILWDGFGVSHHNVYVMHLGIESSFVKWYSLITRTDGKKPGSAPMVFWYNFNHIAFQGLFWKLVTRSFVVFLSPVICSKSASWRNVGRPLARMFCWSKKDATESAKNWCYHFGTMRTRLLQVDF